jgi:solute carrier family 12 (potassium/chloride transporters), member 8
MLILQQTKHKILLSSDYYTRDALQYCYLDAGIIGFNFQLLLNNTGPDYDPVIIFNNNNQTITKEGGKDSFFSVLGVFFPSATGVLAGFNMRCDINDPTFSIPVGTLTAIGVW